MSGRYDYHDDYYCDVHEAAVDPASMCPDCEKDLGHYHDVHCAPVVLPWQARLLIAVAVVAPAIIAAWWLR